MTPNQEDALYNFLENVTEPFTLDDVTEFVRMLDPKRTGNLPLEIAAHIDSRNVAFRLDSRQWLSRRGCFENVPFVICPTKLELLNGILIPGHRCIPFANPVAMPHEYEFFWHGVQIPWTTTEGPPEEFYPYYYIFGEEYAPQYVARDNPENESAFNCDPYEDPPEVSIHTLDMRNIFREASFVPGDRFVVRTRDWKEAHFDLEKAGKDEWPDSDLFAWFEAAEGGFEDSFALLGPGSSTEEQIAYAYWYGGKRMRELPAYSLEEFLFEKTDRIEKITYGIESRFWFAGKDIPDTKGLAGIAVPPDRTPIEDMLFKANVPVSEYVILSYVRDSLYRNDTDIVTVLERIVPPVISLDEADWDKLADYIDNATDELKGRYTLFIDQKMGPLRQRTGELHNAVVDLAARLQKGEMDSSWLPRHTFIMLSQIQGHAASLLEDLDSDEAPPESELDAMDNSLDSMIETFDDIKETIDNAMNNFRRNNLMVVRHGRDNAPADAWRPVQISVSGTAVWRRALVPEDSMLEDLHRLIQISMEWKDSYRHRFYAGGGSGGMDRASLDDKMRVREICDQGIGEIEYEYGTKWSVKAIILSPYQPAKDEAIRCVAGEGAAPPETVSGPLRFRKILGAIADGSDMEKQAALHEMGPDFVPGLFDIETCNRNLSSAGFATRRV
ncbi:MAG: plasmid pRiA4b ORF-3 family protein [Treponema sp.]|nr:plasmid pRiA4b ORF-3 family protein [Treponema sp.]